RPLVHLYATLAKQIGKRNVITTLINLTSAALHLGCLLKGHLLLPTDIHSLEDVIASDAESDQAELACIRNMHYSGVQGRTTSLHNSLYVALAVSPLMLLNPQEYTEVGAKETVFKLWNHIGRLERPPAIMAADCALWKVLFLAALGGDLIHELSSAFHQLEGIVREAAPQWVHLVKGPPPARRLILLPSTDECEGSDEPTLDVLHFPLHSNSIIERTESVSNVLLFPDGDVFCNLSEHSPFPSYDTSYGAEPVVESSDPQFFDAQSLPVPSHQALNVHTLSSPSHQASFEDLSLDGSLTRPNGVVPLLCQAPDGGLDVPILPLPPSKPLFGCPFPSCDAGMNPVDIELPPMQNSDGPPSPLSSPSHLLSGHDDATGSEDDGLNLSPEPVEVTEVDVEKKEGENKLDGHPRSKRPSEENTSGNKPKHPPPSPKKPDGKKDGSKKDGGKTDGGKKDGGKTGGGKKDGGKKDDGKTDGEKQKHSKKNGDKGNGKSTQHDDQMKQLKLGNGVGQMPPVLIDLTLDDTVSTVLAVL
ncbi:hypothetical protein C0995_011179, partial [Termitomyces sp. Mi166